MALIQTTVTLLATDVKDLHTIPMTLIAAQGLGKTIAVVLCIPKMVAGLVPYAGGCPLKARYIGTDEIAFEFTHYLMTTGASLSRSKAIYPKSDCYCDVLQSDLSDKGIELTVEEAFTLGTGILTLDIWYVVN